MNSSVILSLHHLSCTIPLQETSKMLLHDIHLHIHSKEWVTIVGTNGSGKSTLAKVIAGLHPITEGSMTSSIPGNPAAQLVFQNPDTSIIGETVYEDVCFGLVNYGVSEPALEQIAMKALGRVGLASLAHTPASSLSGGQKQLLAIAGCLAVSPSLYIFDEATSMLDPLSRKTILELAHQLHVEGSTVIWITQLLDELTGSDRVIALESGRVAFDGSSREFFYGTAADYMVNSLSDAGMTPCESLGFTPPYVVAVAQRLIRQGCVLKTKPLSPEELSHVVGVLCQ
ncbi:ATP-binding cassette domain-containing protein [Paenibacillus sp. UNC451MF]|uniref:ATP-binding cassette domain-containing protein n=1 Tax=Paenibacillus sp. UNC451MF TaxID=1449063 RepID=UPI00048E5437|nr:ATP-binding cassette domain-containing protein [Paenibacillus sp. UNC451MF]